MGARYSAVQSCVSAHIALDHAALRGVTRRNYYSISLQGRNQIRALHFVRTIVM